MNVIICTYGTGIGGMEVMFSGLIAYSLKEGHNVFFLSPDDKDNIYHSLLAPYLNKIKWIDIKHYRIFEMNSSQRSRMRNKVLSNLYLGPEETVAIAGYYKDIAFLSELFCQNDHIHLLTIWSHPLEWINRLYIDNRKYHFEIKKGDPQYEFQRSFLREIDYKKGHYYTSYAIFDYNRWYYNLDLPDRIIEGLPIQNNDETQFEYVFTPGQNYLRFLWVGRFDYFKNDAIVRVLHELEEIGKSNPSTKIIFNIIGHGSGFYESDIQKRCTSEIVDVNIEGPVSPNLLNSIFLKNDIGIAMGVTVKQMGYAGLPAIIVDSLSDSYNPVNFCNWIFEIETGDDGDGMYYAKMGSPLLSRKSIKDTILPIINDPQLLNEYSIKCKQFVIDHYDYERQNQMILKRAINSEFYGYSHSIFEYSKFKKITLKLFRMKRRFYNLKNRINKTK